MTSVRHLAQIRAARALVLLVVCGAAFALAAGSPAAETGVPPPQQATRATLPNGLRVVIVENPLAPVATVMLNYLAGSDEAPAGFPGTAHALEHMMFRGSPGLSAGQLADLSANLGGDSNADTQQGITQYFFTVPVEDLEVTLHLEAVRMRGLLAREKLWSQERGAIEQEVAEDLSNPDYLCYSRLLEIFFKGTPYEHDALGTRPSFDKTTEAMLRGFHKSWYAPNNAILIIVGDVPPEAALELVRKLFGDIPARKLPERPEYHFRPVTPETLHFDTDQAQGEAVVAFRFPGSDSPDFAAGQILADVLGSERGKLYALVPDGKALSATFSYDSLPKAGLGYATVGYPASGDSRALLNQVRAILAAEVTNGISAELVEAAKRLEIAGAEFQRNSVLGLAMQWSQALAIEGRQSPDDDVDAIRRVTVGDVNRAARRYLAMDESVTAILAPKPSGQPVSPKGFGGAESFTPERTKSVKLPVWAEQTANRLELPTSRLLPVVTNFPNGLRLIIQPETVSDTVSVFGRIKNNPKVETPPGKEGVDATLDQLFTYGTQMLDRLAFQKALDDIGATEVAGTNFSVQVLSEHFERAVELLAGNELSPALPDDAFKIVQLQLAAAVAGELESANHLAARAFAAALFPTNDPVQRETTPVTVNTLSLQDVKDYYRRVYRPDLTTLVVIGNVTPERAEAAIAKYFGAWTAPGAPPGTQLPPAPPNAPSVTRVPDASRVQVAATLAQSLALTRTNRDYYALELGNHVLGGGFYATRLYRDLRENSGLVYYVASTFDVGQTRGVYRLEYGCDPPNVSKARAIAVSNLRDLQSKNVTDGELRQAKVLLLREITLAESSIDRIANGWLARSTLDLPLDEPARAARRYLALSADDVRSAFARWLRPADLVEVTQGPEGK